MNKYSTGFWTTLLVFLSYQIYHAVYDVPPLPDLPKDQWWGPANPPKSLDTSIRPFKIQFKQERISQLKARLTDVNWFTKPLDGTGFQYGFNTKYLKEVAEFWRSKYDFSEREKLLNKLPQFKTNIQGLDIHFIQVNQPNPKKLRVVPLLVMYCWPVNNRKLIEELLKPKEGSDFVYSIVSPSLPGFGYSESATKPGLGPAQIAVMMDNLMERLGHKTYIVHGGDWGAEIAAIMSILYPKKIQGLHTTFPLVFTPASILKHILFGIFPSVLVESKHVPKLYPFSDYFKNLLGEYGHLPLQSTKPDTFGLAIQDSPIGLAAYLLEKFSTGTDRMLKTEYDGGLSKMFSLSELLDNVMVFWDSGSITTSMRFSAETFSKSHLKLEIQRIPVNVPTVILRPTNELFFFSACQLRERFFNILRVTDIEDAGHYAGLQVPEVIANDLWKSVEEFEKF